MERWFDISYYGRIPRLMKPRIWNLRILNIWGFTWVWGCLSSVPIQWNLAAGRKLYHCNRYSGGRVWCTAAQRPAGNAISCFRTDSRHANSHRTRQSCPRAPRRCCCWRDTGSGDSSACWRLATRCWGCSSPCPGARACPPAQRRRQHEWNWSGSCQDRSSGVRWT